jgi:hypothetical protein
MKISTKLDAHRWLLLAVLGGLGVCVGSCIGRSGGVTEMDGSDVSESGTVVAPSELASSPIDGDTGVGVPAQVFVSFDRRFQVLEGFGAATAWFQDRITGDTPKGIYEMLFPELGLDILRLRNRYERLEPGDKKLDDDKEIVERVMLGVVNESCRCLAEGIAIRPSDIDVACVMGMGFPNYRGGIMKWADTLGSKYICETLSRWADARGGAFYAPCDYLKQKAQKGERLAG